MTPHVIVTYDDQAGVSRCRVCQEPVIVLHERRRDPGLVVTSPSPGMFDSGKDTDEA